MYSLWTVNQLKEELKKRGATLKGRKADLVNRLESFDRNFNFGIPQNTETDDTKMTLPPLESYRDLNSSTVLPPITKQHIRLYFNEFYKKPDAGLQLYESRFLLVIRSSTLQEHTYIKGLCKASMKKLQYEANVKLDQTGQIVETSCECVAGSGVNAHCKHVAVVLFAVEHMVREKKIIKHLVPTEKLQKFHMPKSVFTSSPLKTSKLPTKRKIENIIFSPCTVKVNKQEYNEKFRGLITNYGSSSMPLKQLYEPANPYGMEWDHCYSNSSEEKKLLDRLNLISVTTSQATSIELKTRGQANNKNWQMHREVRITSSKFHTVCHLKKTSLENYANQILNQQQFKSRATNHGIIHEKVALSLYMEETSLQVTECGLFISTERPYLAASPDGLLGEETVIEIKCPYSSRYQTISHITVPYLIQKNGVLELKKTSPCYYQIQGQLYCSNRKYCNLLVYTFQDIQTVFVERDEKFINEMLVHLDSFYNNVFKKSVLNKFIYKNYLDIIKKTI